MHEFKLMDNKCIHNQLVIDSGLFGLYVNVHATVNALSMLLVYQLKNKTSTKTANKLRFSRRIPDFPLDWIHCIQKKKKKNQTLTLIV